METSSSSEWPTEALCPPSPPTPGVQGRNSEVWLHYFHRPLIREPGRGRPIDHTLGEVLLEQKYCGPPHSSRRGWEVWFFPPSVIIFPVTSQSSLFGTVSPIRPERRPFWAFSGKRKMPKVHVRRECNIEGSECCCLEKGTARDGGRAQGLSSEG